MKLFSISFEHEKGGAIYTNSFNDFQEAFEEAKKLAQVVMADLDLDTVELFGNQASYDLAESRGIFRGLILEVESEAKNV